MDCSTSAAALSFVQVLPPGVYVAMNGQHFRWNAVRKNTETGCFEAVTHYERRRRAAVEAARRSGTTIFTVMSRLASDLGAINLSQGFPDFDCDPELVEAVARHMRAGRNQYAPMQGVPALREAIAAKYADFHGRRYDPETEVTVTSGGTEAIFDAVAAVLPSRRRGHRPRALLRLLHAGDRVERRRRRRRAAALSGLQHRLARGPRGDHAEDANADHQHPAQPGGRGADVATISGTDRAREGTDLLIVSDEVYEHIIFDGLQHESMARHPRARAPAASSSDRSARPITRPAGRSATPSRQRS